MGLSDGRKSFRIGLAVLIQYRSVTDTQPPSQPRCHSYYALCKSVEPNNRIQIYNVPKLLLQQACKCHFQNSAFGQIANILASIATLCCRLFLSNSFYFNHTDALESKCITKFQLSKYCSWVK